MSTTLDMDRNPCPDRILGDVGVGFAIGATGGSAFHFIKGLYHSPNGHRLGGGATAVRMNAPRVGGSFAVWSGLFSTFDCALVYARRKEDPWNAIMAGACTGGLLALRGGLRSAARHAAAGAALLALIEGTGLMLSRMSDVPPPPEPEYTPPPFDSPAPTTADGFPSRLIREQEELPSPVRTGFLGGLFGRKQQEQTKVAVKSSGVLELDLPSTAVPSFD